MDNSFIINIEKDLYKELNNLYLLELNNKKETKEYNDILSSYKNNLEIEKSLISKIDNNEYKNNKYKDLEDYSGARTLKDNDLIKQRIIRKVNYYPYVKYFFKDIYIFFINLIEKEIKNNISIDYKKELLKIKYNILFLNPLIEEQLLKNNFEAKNQYLDMMTYKDNNNDFLTYKSIVKLNNLLSFTIINKMMPVIKKLTVFDLFKPENIYHLKMDMLFIRSLLIYFSIDEIKELNESINSTYFIFDNKTYAYEEINNTFKEAIKDKKDIKILSLKPINFN